MGTQKPLRFLQKGEPGDSPPLTLCLSHVRPGGEGDPRQGDPAAAGPLASGREGVKPAGPTTPPYQARPSTVAMATSRPARPPPQPYRAPPAHAQGAPRRYRSQRRRVASGGGSAARPDMAPRRKAASVPVTANRRREGGRREKKTGGAAGARRSFIERNNDRAAGGEGSCPPGESTGEGPRGEVKAAKERLPPVVLGFWFVWVFFPKLVPIRRWG